jgi:uncharacterized protein
MAITTPCIHVCMLDPKTGWCLGCGRTGHEIGCWSAFSEAERAKVMVELPARMERLGPPPAPRVRQRR